MRGGQVDVRLREMEELRKAFGFVDMTKIENIKCCTTGVTAFDLAMSGGFPEGRLTEVFGEFQTGKSLLCYQAIREVQRVGGFVFLLDSERSLDPRWVKALGIDVTQMVYDTPESLEDAFKKMEGVVKHVRANAKVYENHPFLIVYDSLATSVAKKELEGEFGDPEMGIRARVISSSLRKLINLIADHRVSLIFVNQLRSKIGVLVGLKEETTGGRAPKFYASLRVSMRGRGKILDAEDRVIGFKGILEVQKSRIGIPFRSVEFELLFKKGFPKFSGLGAYLQGQGVFQIGGGGWITFEGHRFRSTQVEEKWPEIEALVMERLVTLDAMELTVPVAEARVVEGDTE